MSRGARAELLELQIEIRQLELDVTDLNDEISTHPKKPINGFVVEHELDEWRVIKAALDAEKAEIRERKAQAVSRRDELSRQLSQEPVSLVTLSHMITKLTDIEARFKVEDATEAWDALTGFIDWLDTEEKRLKAKEAS